MLLSFVFFSFYAFDNPARWRKAFNDFPKENKTVYSSHSDIMYDGKFM